MDYRTHSLAEKSSRYDDKISRSIAKWAKHLQVQMKSQVLDLFNPNSIIIFIPALKLERDTNGVHGDAAL